MNSHTKILSYDNRVLIFWTLIAILVFSLGFYIFGVNATVRNTVVRQNLEADVASLTLKISEMEFSYIDLKNNVNIELAYERGYQDVVSPTFITRGASGSLSYNTVSR